MILLAFGWGAPHVRALPCDPAINNCGTALDFSYSNLVPTSQGFSFRLDTISAGHATFVVYACVVTPAECAASPLTNGVFWKLLGNGYDDQLPKTFSLSVLRPNTKYQNYTIRVSDPLSNPTPRSLSIALTNLITLPAFTPSYVTASNLQPTQATVSWNTAFSGAAFLIYSLHPPLLAPERINLPTADFFNLIIPACLP